MSDEFSFEVTEIDIIPVQISIHKLLLGLIEILFPGLEPMEIHDTEMKEDENNEREILV